MSDDFGKQTEITKEDIDKFFDKMINGDFDIKLRPCWKCGKEFLPNYDTMKCDTCWFSQFPKESVEAFYRSFLE